jgi:molecular chaperone GrpE
MSSPDSKTENQTSENAAAQAADVAFSGNEVERLNQEVREANDRALRAHAELENARKRWRRDLDDERKYAALPLVRDLLAVLDNLERAIAAAQKAQSGAELLDGVKMVIQMFEATLAQHGCVRIDAAGATFDPSIHEAIAQEPSAEIPAGHVSRAMQVGYKLHDRVVRPAQVFVSTGPAT